MILAKKIMMTQNVNFVGDDIRKIYIDKNGLSVPCAFARLTKNVEKSVAIHSLVHFVKNKAKAKKDSCLAKAN
ncbi:unnamed protein product [Acanthoscelides obtectus]|uniref:Uncharacterized protein n=1 Tax=Acanthoscelides obtectus TaxID=200917 RepID=A0A9P0LGC0_ACAOB|nr:unnamed protein product [Acanthoscelides obtectus]CAK1662253.1 hypothetical protein AOBTE_LOCUS23057 [Acanthoscelides obtectus]